ncbi:MAG: transketolase [Rhodococcus sp. (in: high G+C Gram-positive bacteria)]
MSITVEKSLDQREIFYRLVPQLLADDERLALVIAEIGAAYLEPHIAPEVRPRVVNVGIREQAMIGVASGMALAGMRPIVHTFPPFLIERPFEQVKLDLGHQGVGAVLVSSGGSYGWPQGGETHFGQRDVALLDTLDGWTVHVPGHIDEVDWMLRSAVAGDDRVYIRLNGISNEHPYGRDGGFIVLQQGKSGTVVSVGPMTDRVLAAARGRDVTVLHASTIRPFDADTLRNTLTTPDVMLVEPYLAGTSVPQVNRAVADMRTRVSGIGVEARERRRYGTVREHDRANGLDVEGLTRAMDRFFDSSGA